MTGGAPFCEWTGSWLEVIRARGLDEVQRVYLDLLDGHVEAKTAHVLSPD
jgi:hypothetical protein